MSENITINNYWTNFKYTVKLINIHIKFNKFFNKNLLKITNIIKIYTHVC